MRLSRIVLFASSDAMMTTGSTSQRKSVEKLTRDEHKLWPKTNLPMRHRKLAAWFISCISDGIHRNAHKAFQRIHQNLWQILHVWRQTHIQPLFIINHSEPKICLESRLMSTTATSQEEKKNKQKQIRRTKLPKATRLWKPLHSCWIIGAPLRNQRRTSEQQINNMQ